MCDLKDRRYWGRNVTRIAAYKLARKALLQSLPMTCEPPPPQAAFPYGDLVPLGFLLLGLTSINPETDAVESRLTVRISQVVNELRNRLLKSREGKLYAFHTGRLVTATDSALVMLGMGLKESHDVEALEAFSDGRGGYFPQLWATKARSGRMCIDPANQHWRQTDFATTCLIRNLRGEMSLQTRTPLALLETDFEKRSGLFFANPYLVDWGLALAIKYDDHAIALRERLLAELLASANTDGSFGSYDVPLSTSLAILALDALGYRGRVVRIAKFRLFDALEVKEWPVSTPFYSTFLLDGEFNHASSLPEQHVLYRGQLHELSLYRDTYRVIFTGLAAAALAVTCQHLPDDLESSVSHTDAHSRYRCQSIPDYVASFALPPYIDRLKSDQPLG